MAEWHSSPDADGGTITWEQIVKRRLEGETVVEIPDEVNFPPITDSSADAWQTTLRALETGNQALRESIRLIDDVKLEEGVPATNYWVCSRLPIGRD